MSEESNKRVCELALYDTSNFYDFPLGGQLTSVRNFLRYVAEYQPDFVSHVVLVGVTLNPECVGKFTRVRISGQDFSFLPVALAEADQGHTQKSLRLKYAKGLMRYLSKAGLRRSTVNYIHTPEAYGPVKLRGKGRCAIFSHGSFFNMRKGFRFYKDSWIARAFERYLVWMLKGADRLFVIDDDSYSQYIQLNHNVSLVSNSIDYREDVRRVIDPNAVNLLFVGRLSAGKRIGPIIEAAESMPEVASLTIVGEGEEGDKLRTMAGPKTIFAGALGHDAVREQMRKADIFVMNSEFEGVPMAILEAMSMALPIVTTDVGGISRAVDFGLNADATDGTVGSIILGVRKILGNYETMAHSAFERSRQFYYVTTSQEIYSILQGMSQ